MGRDQKGRDFFARGRGENVTLKRRITYSASLLDLMQAYARVKTREDFTPLTLKRGAVFTMEQALDRMRGLLGAAQDWADLAEYLPEGWRLDRRKRRSATASTFAAALELVKEGKAELRQQETFAPLELRARTTPRGEALRD